MKIALPMLVYTTLLHQISVVVKSRIKSSAKRHEKNISEFRKRHQKSDIKICVQVSKKYDTIFRHIGYQMTELWHLILD